MSYFAINKKTHVLGKHKLEVLGEIRAEDYMMIERSFSFISSCKSVEHIKDIVCHNKTVLKSYVSDEWIAKLSVDGVDVTSILTAANAYALNYATSIRTFLDIMHANLSTRKDDLKYMRNLESACFDKYFDYRLWYRLRNFIVHRSLPYTRIVQSLIDSSGVRCDRDFLLGWDGWGSIRREIASLPERINLADYLDGTSISVEFLFAEYIACFGQEITDCSRLVSTMRKKYGITGGFMYAKAKSREHMHSDGILSHADIGMFPEREFLHYFNILKSNPRVTIVEVDETTTL